MRSAISKISSRSWLITSTAAPRAARSISAWRMVAAAPASTPQVGWLTTSTPGSRSDLAADDEFLQIAARERAGLRVGAALAHVEGLGDRGRDRAAPRRGRRSRALATPPVAWRDSTTFSRQRHARRGAVAEALLRHEGGTRRRRASMPSPADAAPSMRIAPASLGARPRPTSPRRTRPGRCRPRRRSPTISPPRTSREMSLQRDRHASSSGAGETRFEHRSARGRAPAAGAARTAATSRADHHARELRGASPGAGRSRPPPCRARSMVARWHSRFTSSSRCEM